MEEAEGHSFQGRSSHSQAPYSPPNDGGHDVTLYKSKNLFSKGFGSLNLMRTQGHLCDVTIRVGDREFLAHKALLAATVPYFYGMFTSEFEDHLPDCFNPYLSMSILSHCLNLLICSFAPSPNT